MIENQAYVFLWTILIGSIMGIIFDFFRALRRKGNTRDIWVYIQDIIFWIIVTIIVICSTFLINDGELRGYMVLGYILGGVFYLLLFSKWIRKIFNLVFDFFDKIFAFIFKIIDKLTRKLKTLCKKNKKLEN